MTSPPSPPLLPGPGGEVLPGGAGGEVFMLLLQPVNQSHGCFKRH
jgi:hypothetical protein